MSGYYQFIPFKPNAWRITSGEGVFMELLVGAHQALLFDTGYGFGPLAEEIRQVTVLPLTVVCSHGHLDHVLGNPRFHRPIFIHPQDMALCRQVNEPSSRLGAVGHAKQTIDFQTGQMKNILPDGFDEAQYQSAQMPELIPLEEGRRFDLGGITLDVIHLPGHTGGSIGLLWREEKVLYTGDAITPFLWLFGPEATGRQEYIRTVQKARALEVGTILCGHNPMPMPRAAFDNFLDAAVNADYATGTPFTPFFSDKPLARICPRKGYGPFDFETPGFASLVVSEKNFQR